MSKFGDLIRGKSAPAPAVAPPAPAPEPVVVEAPAPEPELKDMSKKELEELGRTMGVELDRRLSRSSWLNKLKNYNLKIDRPLANWTRGREPPFFVIITSVKQNN